MNKAHTVKVISVERSVVCIVGMGGDENSAADKAGYYGRMIPFAVGVAELYEVSDIERALPDFRAERTRALVLGHKVIEVLHARPRRGAVVRALIIPAENGRKVHNSATCEHALRCKIRAISAQRAEVVEVGVTSVRPFSCVVYRRLSVIAHCIALNKGDKLDAEIIAGDVNFGGQTAQHHVLRRCGINYARLRRHIRRAYHKVDTYAIAYVGSQELLKRAEVRRFVYVCEVVGDYYCHIMVSFNYVKE